MHEPRPSGRKLRALRISRGLNFSQLSDVSDIDRRTLSRWEKGIPARWSGPVLKKLADFYGLSEAAFYEEAAAPVADARGRKSEQPDYPRDWSL